MTCDDSAFDGSDSDDFQRWYFGGSPPESDGWERHAFENALQGAPAASHRFDQAPMTEPISPRPCAFDRESIEAALA